MERKKLDIGLYGFTGCNGDQLVIVHSEDKLLDFFGSANIKSFSLAKSDNEQSGLDIAFIEIAVTGGFINPLRRQQFLLVVETDRLDGKSRDSGKLSNAEHRSLQPD